MSFMISSSLLLFKLDNIPIRDRVPNTPIPHHSPGYAAHIPRSERELP
jgi:hypothetical protein